MSGVHTNNYSISAPLVQRAQVQHAHFGRIILTVCEFRINPTDNTWHRFGTMTTAPATVSDDDHPLVQILPWLEERDEHAEKGTYRTLPKATIESEMYNSLDKFVQPCGKWEFVRINGPKVFTSSTGGTLIAVKVRVHCSIDGTNVKPHDEFSVKPRPGETTITGSGDFIFKIPKTL